MNDDVAGPPPVINLARAKADAQEMSARDVYRDMDRAESEGGTITPATAVLVASWYQGPGEVGHVLAALASGVDVDRHEVLVDIHNTRYRLRRRRRDSRLRELDLLAAFIHHYR